jgi:hypothetical protein
MKAAIIGSRTFKDYELLKEILKHVYISQIITGESEGTDELAKKYAAEKGIPLQIVKHDELKPSHPRTFQIIDKANLVIAFWDGKSQGTCDLIKYAQKLQKPIKIESFKPD